METRLTKVFAFEDPVTIGFPGARALVRTYRETRQLVDGKTVGELTKVVAYQLSSHDPYSHRRRSSRGSCAGIGAWGVRVRDY